MYGCLNNQQYYAVLWKKNRFFLILRNTFLKESDGGEEKI